MLNLDFSPEHAASNLVIALDVRVYILVVSRMLNALMICSCLAMEKSRRVASTQAQALLHTTTLLKYISCLLSRISI